MKKKIDVLESKTSNEHIMNIVSTLSDRFNVCEPSFNTQSTIGECDPITESNSIEMKKDSLEQIQDHCCNQLMELIKENCTYLEGRNLALEDSIQ